jgi:gas vesicle protein
MTKDDATVAFLGFVLGVGVGAVSALLLAPKAGEELRDDIAGAVSDGVEHIRGQAKGLKRRAEKLVDAAKDQVQTVLNEGEIAHKKAKKAGA